MKQSRFIEQIMVVGEGEKLPAALIQPNFEFLFEWAKRHNMEFQNTEEAIANPKVLDRFKEEVEQANEHFAKWEKVKLFKLTPDVWSVDEGHLTPTMKLKRKIIKEKYIDLYNDIYNH